MTYMILHMISYNHISFIEIKKIYWSCTLRLSDESRKAFVFFLCLLSF